MRIWRIAGALALLAPLAAGGLSASPAAADTSCTALTAQVSQMTHATSGTSLLTQFDAEVKSAKNYGFTLSDSSVMRVATSGGTDRVAVWRVYNPATTDFSWAAEGSDLQAMKNRGYEVQFRQFYGATKQSDCAAPVFRLGKNSVTQLALGTSNRDALVRSGWTVQSSNIFYAATASTPGEPVTPGQPGQAAESFTLAVIPDTQQETWSDSDTRFRDRSTWLVDNAAQLNLKFVTHVGDVVDWGAVAPAQFTRAKAGLAPLGNKVPYSLTIGNHDTAAVCQGGAACPGANANVTVRDTTAFNAAFPLSSFSNVRGQYEAGKVDNTYSTFAAGGQKWMVLNLELWPRQGAIDWAKRVVAANPDHNVIVSTHSYLNGNGTIGTTNGGYGATSPKHLFDTFISIYPNIKLVLSGHTGGAASRVDTGVNGNKILSLLQTFHSRTTNPVRLVIFNVADGTIQTSVYAPKTKETMVSEETISGFNFRR